MPKPKQIFLLEVKFTNRTFYRGPGGGIFRTERDMNQRIDTIKFRAEKSGQQYELKKYVLDAEWTPLDD